MELGYEYERWLHSHGQKRFAPLIGTWDKITMLGKIPLLAIIEFGKQSDFLPKQEGDFLNKKK